MVVSEPALLRCQGVRVGSLDPLCACASPFPIQLHLWTLQQISLILQTTSGGPGVQRFFLTEKSTLTHAVIKSLWCRQRAAWALLPWAGTATKSCHPGCLTAYSNWHPLDLCGSAANVRAMVSLYEKYPKKLTLELTMIWLFSKIPLACSFQWLTGLCGWGGYLNKKILFCLQSHPLIYQAN